MESRAWIFVVGHGNMESHERSVLQKSICKFREVFSELPDKARNYLWDLGVREHRPFVYKSCLVPYSKREAVQEELNMMTEIIDIIEKLVSSYANSVVM